MSKRRTPAQASSHKIAMAGAQAKPPVGAEIQMLALPLYEDASAEHDAIRALMARRLKHDCALPAPCLHRNHRRDRAAVADDMELLGLDEKARRARVPAAPDEKRAPVPEAVLEQLQGVLR
jgi:hypothetical protein